MDAECTCFEHKLSCSSIESTRTTQAIVHFWQIWRQNQIAIYTSKMINACMYFKLYKFYHLLKKIVLKRDDKGVLHPTPAIAQTLLVKADWTLPMKPNRSSIKLAKLEWYKDESIDVHKICKTRFWNSFTWVVALIIALELVRGEHCHFNKMIEDKSTKACGGKVI
jgi:hypothetical protein